PDAEAAGVSFEEYLEAVTTEARSNGRDVPWAVPCDWQLRRSIYRAKMPTQGWWVVTRAPSFLRTSLRGSWKGLGADRGDCWWWSPFEGLHDTAALGSPEVVDRLQEDAP